MRVVGGRAKGITLSAVPGDTTRPILDRVKVPLFDILRPQLAGARVLDLFAGTGQIGIEAVSQGALHCTFLDLAPKAVQTIKENLARTRLTEQAEVRHTDAFTYLRNSSRQFDLIFVAPPQYKALWVEAMHAIAERPQLVSPGGTVVAQIDPREYEALALHAFEEREQRKYGNTMLVFYRRSDG